jgi:IS30 family transposase
MVERKSRYTIAIKNRRKDWSETLGQIRDRLKELPEAARQTLTLDRGIEFRHPQCLTSNMRIGVYYCDGGSPWQKGTVENTNGRMRRWLPKNYEIENLNQEGIDRIIEIMNNTPRKCLKYRTPNEVFSKFLSNCCT